MTASSLGGRIDSHHHLWSLARGDYGWLTPEFDVLFKDFLPIDLENIIQKTAVKHTVLVQAAPTLAETRYLLSLAEESSSIAAVVGWVDMEASEAVSQISDLSRHAKFRGIRPMIQNIPDPNWMLKPELGPAFRALERLDLSFDALISTIHIGNLLEIAQRYPALRMVINHAAKPNIAGGVFSDWAKVMKKISESTNVYCKISGLLTEAEPGATVQSLKPWVDHLIECFGAERLMWGSDWPVLNLASNYKRWAEMSDVLFAELSGAEQNSIYGETACAFYKI
ncbi:MAG: amidohydrolase family protein [Methylococcaceae bacterium]